MRQITYAIALFFFLSIAAGCGRKEPAPTVEVVASYSQTLPTKPDDPVWDRTPLHVESLLLQDLVEPRLIDPSTGEARLKAYTDGVRVSFLVQWEDATRNDQPSASRFPDTCAVQLPAKVEQDAPDPQMGEPGRPVEITYWSAFWQASLDGRSDTIQELHPGATVDHYPFQAPTLKQGSEEQTSMALRYAPARMLGNFMAGPRDSAVQDLIAEGPGTLSPADDPVSTGEGLRTENGWAVVFSRPLPEGLRIGGQAQVAVAISDGSRNEGGSRKMRSAWIPLILEEPE